MPKAQTVDAFCARYIERFALNVDSELSYRQLRLHILNKFFDDTIYDNLLPFSKEYTGSDATGKYIPLVQRRPSVIYSILSNVVNESTSMLFGESHFPTVRCEDKETMDFLHYVTKDSNLQSIMIEAARIGSIGSVAILVKILNGKFYFDVINAESLTPVFNWQDPDILIKISEMRKYLGSNLMTMGYEIAKDDQNKWFWLKREWNDTEEIYYKPYLIDNNEGEQAKLITDDERSSTHDLGFVPIIWIKNIPKTESTDGMCTFEKIIDMSIEINYQLSQLGRGLKYNSDPTLVVKNPSPLKDRELIKGAGLLELEETGDAKLLEMSGNSTKSVLDFVNLLRQYALEIARGDRTNPEKLNAAHSGKALEFLNMALISLVAELRISYGEKGLLRVYQMIIEFVKTNKIDLSYKDKMPNYKESYETELQLHWEPYYTSSSQDELQWSQSIKTYREAGLLSQKTGINSIADTFNIEDTDEEISSIEKESEELYDSKNAEPVDRESSDVDRN